VFVLPDYAMRLLRAFDEPALFVSADGLVLAANASARTVLGIRSEMPESCDLATVLGGSQRSLPSTLRAWAASVEPIAGTLTLCLALESVTFEAQGSTIFSRCGGVPEVLLVRLRDRQDPVVLLNQKLGELNAEITRRIRTEGALLASEAALRSRATEAEALNRAKDEFLGTVSHELRTPLNAILGWVDLLRKGPVNPEVDRAAAVIHRNAKAQAKLIEDLIDVSRIISGKFRIEPHDCDLVTLIDDALASIRAGAEAKRLELTREVPEPGCAVFGDAARIRQVLGNLLSNALKFSETGGRIHVGLCAEAETVTLSITDSGSGIEPAFLPFVFERFKQADGSNTRHVGGLGLGLALVRHIVEAHGGAVEAQSDGKDRGATFVVTLPIRAVAAPPSVSSYSVDVAGLAPPAPSVSTT